VLLHFLRHICTYEYPDYSLVSVFFFLLFPALVFFWYLCAHWLLLLFFFLFPFSSSLPNMCGLQLCVLGFYVRVAIRTFFVFVLSIGESSSCLFSFSLAVVFFLAL
jgi:hypothetical protein